MNQTNLFDVAIIGAGLAGLTCARILKQAGYSTVILEKSRGVGGRVATRRVQNTCADHGLRYLSPKGELSQNLINTMNSECDILKIWTDQVYQIKNGYLLPMDEPCYVAPDGMTSIAKFLAKDLEIWLRLRAIDLDITLNKTWQITLEITDNIAEPKQVEARYLVVAIPAPQAVEISKSLFIKQQIDPALFDYLCSREFDPCFSVIAAYPSTKESDLVNLEPNWKSLLFAPDPFLSWIGLDSSKRPHSQQPLFVLQSSPNFAQHYLENMDVKSIGQELLNYASNRLIPWLNKPEWFQVHRWRYAFPRHTQLPPPTNYPNCLPTNTHLPLVYCGDWLGNNLVESALQSGTAAAEWLKLNP